MKNGIDVLIESEFESIRGMRVGLVTHTAARCRDLRGTAEVLANENSIRLIALFGPEHGFSGEAQDLIPVTGDEKQSIPVYTLYGDTFASLKPTNAMLKDLDILIIDMMDIGSRYYTFQTTMLYCMEACAAIGLPLMVLDRPNPIGREVEGPSLQEGFESFVGAHDLCTRHGMTLGELAQLYQAERVPDVKLTVLAGGPSPEEFILPPSPNMPTLRTALVYPGMCLIEGTNLSEGRGTTRPFEYVGFPDVSPQALVEQVTQFPLQDVVFLPVSFRPTFQKHAGLSCGGLFIVPTGPGFQPVRTGLATIMAFRKLLGDAFQWRTETYEFVSHIPAIDLLFGSARERKAIEAGMLFEEIVAPWRNEESMFVKRRAAFMAS